MSIMSNRLLVEVDEGKRGEVTGALLKMEGVLHVAPIGHDLTSDTAFSRLPDEEKVARISDARRSTAAKAS